MSRLVVELIKTDGNNMQRRDDVGNNVKGWSQRIGLG